MAVEALDWLFRDDRGELGAILPEIDELMAIATSRADVQLSVLKHPFDIENWKLIPVQGHSPVAKLIPSTMTAAERDTSDHKRPRILHLSAPEKRPRSGKERSLLVRGLLTILS